HNANCEVFLFAQRSWQTPSVLVTDLALFLGEENPTRKGVSGQRWGLKEAIGSQRERSVSKLDSAGCGSERAKRREARYRNNCNK
ncbi:MAG: hypothetical protein ABI557_14785, partial [Aureliella sp.]